MIHNLGNLRELLPGRRPDETNESPAVRVRLGITSARELVEIPANKVAFVDDFSLEQIERLRELMASAHELVIENHLTRAMLEPSIRPRPLWVPVMYVLGSFAEELNAREVGLIHAAGGTFVDRKEWPAVLEDLSKIEI